MYPLPTDAQVGALHVGLPPAARMPQPLPAPRHLGALLEVGRLHRRVSGLQIGDQRLQIAQRLGFGRQRHPRPVLLHGQLPVRERTVEDLARVVAVAVLRPRSRCLPRRHVDDRKSCRQS